jgi:hypothetical protein
MRFNRRYGDDRRTGGDKETGDGMLHGFSPLAGLHNGVENLTANYSAGFSNWGLSGRTPGELLARSSPEPPQEPSRNIFKRAF